LGNTPTLPTQKEHVGAGVRNELDKGLAHELGPLGIRGQDVLQTVDGETATQFHHFHQLLGGLLAPESW